MDKEIQHKNKIGELEAKLTNLKVKEVALHSNKSSKPTTSSKPSKSKSKKVEVESSTSDSGEGEGKKVATVAIKKLPSTSRLFNNLTDDEERSSIHCFMAKGEKVKTSSKSSPPPNDESEKDSSD
jgi:hypothetical protein